MALMIWILVGVAFPAEFTHQGTAATQTAVRVLADEHGWPINVESLPQQWDEEFEWIVAPRGDRLWMPRKTVVSFTYEPEAGPLAAVEAALAAHRESNLPMDYRIESDGPSVSLIATHARGPDGVQTAQPVALDREITLDGESLPFSDAVVRIGKLASSEARPVTFGMVPMNLKQEVTLPKGTMPAREALKHVIEDLNREGPRRRAFDVRWVVIWDYLGSRYVMNVIVTPREQAESVPDAPPRP